LINIIEEFHNYEISAKYDIIPDFETPKQYKETYQKYLDDFMKEYKNDLCLDDFLTAICKLLEKHQALKPIEFLLNDIAEHNDIRDFHKVKIMKYLSNVYPDEINKYRNEIYHLFCCTYGQEEKLKFSEILLDEKYEWFHKLVGNEYITSNATLLFNKYIKQCREMKLMEEEIKIIKAENLEQKKRIEELELHKRFGSDEPFQIKYMLGGEGYQEAYENFRLAQTMINQQFEESQDELVEFYSNT
jgi:hypothetical protein